MAISLPGSFSSGPNWPDGQRYTFNGILIHDMVRDGGIFHPYQYAVDFYAHCPATNLPYGLPGPMPAISQRSFDETIRMLPNQYSNYPAPLL